MGKDLNCRYCRDLFRVDNVLGGTENDTKIYSKGVLVVPYLRFVGRNVSPRPFTTARNNVILHQQSPTNTPATNSFYISSFSFRPSIFFESTELTQYKDLHCLEIYTYFHLCIFQRSSKESSSTIVEAVPFRFLAIIDYDDNDTTRSFIAWSLCAVIIKTTTVVHQSSSFCCCWRPNRQSNASPSVGTNTIGKK